MAGLGKALGKRAGAFGVALTLLDVWRRLPPRQRKWVVKNAKKHGPRIAKAAWTAQRQKRR